MLPKLGLEGHIGEGVKREDIREIPSRKGSMFEHEVLVKFKNVADRDTVKAAAFRLAGDKNSLIRLKLPSHLLSQHRLLSVAGQRLRESRMNCHTNIKFNDEEMDLVLDYRLDGETWRRLRGGEAREVLKDVQGGRVSETAANEFAKLIENVPARSRPQETGVVYDRRLHENLDEARRDGEE